MKNLRKNITFLYQKGKLEGVRVKEKKFIKMADERKRKLSLKKLFLISEYTGIYLYTLANRDITKFEEYKDKIKFVVSDVDGVLTDGGMYFTAKGDEIKRFNSKDGLGIKKLKAANVKTGFLSSGFTDEIVKHRAKMFGVEYVYVGLEKKIDVLIKWCEEMGILLENVAYIGDDINDLEVIDAVGLSACPADAVNDVKEHAHIVLKRKGGEGCFREFIDEWLII